MVIVYAVRTQGGVTVVVYAVCTQGGVMVVVYAVCTQGGSRRVNSGCVCSMYTRGEVTAIVYHMQLA